jgi:threonine synthase
LATGQQNAENGDFAATCLPGRVPDGTFTASHQGNAMPSPEAPPQVKYVSTRGSAPTLGFADVLLAGLARDGGLYLPESWPELPPATIAGFRGKPYADVAVEVIRPFVDVEIDDAALVDMCHEAYATFEDEAVAPLVDIAPDQWLLELFHGPTLAFKDVAMQLLARLMDHVLRERNLRVTIVGATSGDTGGAAIEAFKGRDSADIFILFPQGRVSPIQQRQMTTANAANVHAIAVEGTFDDCQAIVKGLFNNNDFRDRVALAGVNSINWARILAQIVYYFTAAAAVGAPEKPVSFTVPTGNFGDIFAGYAAKRMGLPVEQLVIATNTNDILARTLESGRYELRPVTATASPSMDIQVSSNFERLLFEVLDRDGAAVRRLMDDLKGGSFTLDSPALSAIRRDFAAGRADERETAATMRKVFETSGRVIDPHTAVALSVAGRFAEPGIPMITLATAHPAKFPEAVLAATGHEAPLPQRLGDLITLPERFTVIANDQAAIERFIAGHTRALIEKV